MNTSVISLAGVNVNYIDGDPCSLQKHCHDCYEILCVISGQGEYILEGSSISIRKRSLILLPPLAYHSVTSSSDSGLEAYVIHFQKSLLPDYALSMLDGLFAEQENGRYFSPDSVPESLSALFDQFGVAARLPDEQKRAFVSTLAAQIVILLSAAAGEGVSFADDELGAKVIRYLNSNIEKNVSLDKLAKHFFVSKYHLCRAFKRYSGTSVHAYINHKRIMYAKQLIESGETAQSAAYKVGFGDYSAFYRAYVKIVGVSPKFEHTREGEK